MGKQVSWGKGCTCAAVYFLACFRDWVIKTHVHFLVLVLQDVEGTREEADGLVSKCLLQSVGDDGYRVHDLVLEAMKLNVKVDTEMVKNATALQAQYLSRLDVVQGYCDPRHGAGENGLFFLDALWRSAEELSGDPRLEVDSYSASLKELESCEETEDVANSYARIGFLFNVQVRGYCLAR